MNLRKLRERTGLNQHDFWTRIGITQSGGSRYETENREPPRTVLLLLSIAYGDSSEYNRTIKQIRL